MVDQPGSSFASSSPFSDFFLNLFISPPATTRWVGIPPAAGHAFYASLSVAPDNTFYSLATENAAGQGFDLLHWGLDMTPKVIATFGNAHPVPFFGAVGATVVCNGKQLVSFTVEDHPNPLTGDR